MVWSWSVPPHSTSAEYGTVCFQTLLVVMQSCWIAKPRDEVIEYSFRCRFSRLIFSCIGLGKSREVINYDKNVLITPFAGFKVQEVNGN